MKLRKYVNKYRMGKINKNTMDKGNNMLKKAKKRTKRKNRTSVEIEISDFSESHNRRPKDRITTDKRPTDRRPTRTEYPQTKDPQKIF
ncbi:unnamed protein product [Meloidogyne enterolobii]|uniref:Uncharacterized protein n=1 Tax=Meloidogyne enterolobii TaxID=390850 RepID=A0ACB0Z674_MELEN